MPLHHDLATSLLLKRLKTLPDKISHEAGNETRGRHYLRLLWLCWRTRPDSSPSWPPAPPRPLDCIIIRSEQHLLWWYVHSCLAECFALPVTTSYERSRESCTQARNALNGSGGAGRDSHGLLPGLGVVPGPSIILLGATFREVG
ncbi:hypothetical protein O3P69_002818 [Scylla paramamosain]|uniref:Uncharacterized protein n=1 Tax=Scylla paramamosain TaxID=85552 RepID=A0AAW0UMP8_SCYPA